MTANLKPLIATALLAMLLSGCDLLTLSNTDARAQTELPKSLSIVKKSTSLVSAQCAAGGMELLQGLDFNQDGKLSPYERQTKDIVCYPVSEGQGTVAARPLKNNQKITDSSGES